MNKRYVAVALAAILAGVIGAYALSELHIIPNSAKTVNVDYKIYIDDELWLNNTLLDWGNVYPGETYYCDNLTVANIGDVDLTVSILVEDLPSGWIYTWTANNTICKPNEIVWAALDLTVAADAPLDTTFNWIAYIHCETV